METVQNTPSSPIVLLLGASRGIGLAVLNYFIKETDAIVIAVSRSSPPSSLLESNQCFYISSDLSQIESCQTMIQQVIQKYGKLNSIIYNSGVLEPCRV